MTGWLGIHSQLTDEGFLTPIGYLGHTVLRDPVITSSAQVVAGVGVHLALAAALGATLARILPPASRPVTIMRGLGIGLAVWAVVQYMILYPLDRVAFAGLAPRPHAVGWLIYGWVLGFLIGEHADVAEQAWDL